MDEKSETIGKSTREPIKTIENSETVIKPDQASAGRFQRRNQASFRQNKSNGSQPGFRRSKLIKITYEHFRWFLPTTFFYVMPKSVSADFFVFSSITTDRKLSMRITTPIIRKKRGYNFFLADKPVVFDVFYDDQRIIPWRKVVKLSDHPDPNVFLATCRAMTGQLLRRIHTARTKDQNDFFTLGKHNKKQVFFGSEGKIYKILDFGQIIQTRQPESSPQPEISPADIF